MNRQISINKFITLFLLGGLMITGCFPLSALAYEGYVKNPGSRAMAMAGVFSAQADDSSAIFYNPGALPSYEFIHSDISIEMGQRIGVGKTDTTDDSLSYKATETQATVSFFGAYSNDISYKKISLPFGIGIGYFSPYQLRISVDAIQNPVLGEAYGDVNASYHQISVMMADRLSKQLSLGLSIDNLWTTIDCLEFSPCVDYGPSATGVSIGALYAHRFNENINMNIGGMWRSKAKTYYISSASSGIGTVINDYLPDRPESFSFGINLQTPTKLMMINSNLVYEIVKWDSVAKKGKGLTDYHNVGISMELLTTITGGNTIIFRAGSKLMQSRESILPDVAIGALGIGYEIRKSHIVDFAYEQRRFNSNNENLNTLSISYALQV